MRPFFVFQRIQDHPVQAESQPPSHLRLIPDTIKINGDALSFRAKNQGKTYQVFYTLKSEKEKQQWQSQTHLLELTYKGVIEEPEGQRNFRGFDYRSYLQTQGIHYQIKIEAIQSALPIQTWNVFELAISMEAPSHCLEQGALSATDEPVYDRPSFWLFRYGF